MNQAILPPSEKALPFVDGILAAKPADATPAVNLASLITVLGELPGERVEALLTHALGYRDAKVRFAACISLQLRRCRRALEPLAAMVMSERNAVVAQMGLVAMVASGPTTMGTFSPVWNGCPDRSLWRCIVAGRLRAESEAAFLVETAINAANDWQRRRAAILAASRLPFDAALAKIADSVLRERSPFTIDRTPGLQGHQVLAEVLQFRTDGGFRQLVERNGLEHELRMWYDLFAQGRLNVGKIPSGEAVAQWFCQTLGAPPDLDSSAVHRLISGIHVPILHEATLRGLRMAGRPEHIAKILRTTESEWLLIRAINEFAKCKSTNDVATELEELLESSRFPTSVWARNVINSKRRRANDSERKFEISPPPEIATITFADASNSLKTGQLAVPPAKSPWLLVGDDERLFSRIVASLAPVNDYCTVPHVTEPRMSFVGNGVTVGSVEQQRRDNHAQIRKLLRPAVAAANRFGVHIEWHTKLLDDETYFKAFLQHLGNAGDAGRFYQELREHGDIILPQMDDSILLNPILKFVDARIIPFIRRFVNIGTDGLLESLCSMARRVDEPAIDPLLSALFRRWHNRFDPNSKFAQHTENDALWRALGCLRSHSRFHLIPGYVDRLIEIMNRPLSPFNKNSIVNILKESPRSYAQLECLLFRFASFEYGFGNDVDSLDDAADALFLEVRC